MKKTQLLFLSYFLLLHLSNSLFSQSSYLAKIHKEAEYKYEYWCHVKYNEKNRHQITFSSDSISTILVLNHKNDTIDVIGMEITKDKAQKQIIPFMGFTKLHLSSGKYKILFYGNGLYESYEIRLSIKKDKAVNMIIRLKRKADDTVYQIEAKTRLSKREINKIMQCIEKNRYNYNSECEDQKHYIIDMQI